MASGNSESASMVAPLELANIDPASFTVDEVKYAYYLRHLATLANAVVLEGENRGFIDLVVWRSSKDNKPYNARVIENHLSFTFFYVIDRPWNPYFGDLGLKVRIEAILDFLHERQSEDGRFSEYGPERYALAPTSFGVRVLGETMGLLHESEVVGGPAIDSGVRDRAIATTRKAIQVCLDHPDLLKHAKTFSNQYTGFWGGAMAFLTAYPDSDLEEQLVERVRTFHQELTSPVGYHYERAGCDWAYTMRTHRNNMRHLWHYIRGGELADLITQMEKPWMDWLSYNAVLEPGGDYFTLNKAIETRRHQPGFDHWDSPVVETVPMTRAFHRSREDMDRDYASAREELQETWPSVGELELYSPSIFFGHTAQENWCPTSVERNQAQMKLPYVVHDRFNHLRMDNRFAVHHTFVRRPNYYAIFNAGEIIYETQRHGVGLVWHPVMGSLIQTQSRETGPWGTANNGNVYEVDSFQTLIKADGKTFCPTPGKHDLPDGEVVFEYALGSAGKKMVRFGEDQIEVTVEHTGAFVEHLPLLIREGDDLDSSGGQLRLRRAGGLMMIVCGSEAEIAMHSTDVSHGPFELRRVEIGAQDYLKYSIGFE
jgi:hypothetical protein